MEPETPNFGTEPSDDTVLDPNSVAETRSHRLREAAKLAGGNKALADKAGVPLGTLNGYLAGGEPKVSTLAALAIAADVSIDWLVTGEGSRSRGVDVVPGNHDLQTPNHNRAPGIAYDSAVRGSGLFAIIDIDQFAAALLTADKAFSQRGSSPTPRERAQAIAIIYDMLSTQAAGRTPKENE